MPVRSSIVRTALIPAAKRETMFALLCRYYDNVFHETFLRDLAEKDWVIMFDGETGSLAGFSTLQIIHLPVAGQDKIFLFSGDTIVDRAHWRNSTLAGCFGHFMLRMLAQHPGIALYWFLISKGYRTYRFLPVFFNRFYPTYLCATPPDYLTLLNTIACHKFAAAFDPVSGIVRFAGLKDRLKPEIGRIPAARADDPHIRFFLQRNPAYAAGDELACIADICRDNLNACACRVIENTTVIWDE